MTTADGSSHALDPKLINWTGICVSMRNRSLTLLTEAVYSFIWENGNDQLGYI